MIIYLTNEYSIFNYKTSSITFFVHFHFQVLQQIMLHCAVHFYLRADFKI